MKIGICTLVYNCLDFTKEFIKSIQTKHKYKLIIFDNGSKDGSYEWLKSNELNGYDLTIIHSDTNLGVSVGANRTMQMALEDQEITHILYANNDLIFRPDTIDHLVWAWDSRQDTRIVRVSAVDIRENHFNSYNEGYEKIMNMSMNKVFIYGGSYTCFIWDKWAIQKVGLLDENVDYYDDNIHSEEILRRGYFSVTYLPAIIYHRGSGTLRMNQKEKDLFDKKFIKDREYAFKYFGAKTQDDIREITEQGRPIWTPRIEEINKFINNGGEK